MCLHCAGICSVQGSSMKTWSACWNRDATRTSNDKTYGRGRDEKAKPTPPAKATTRISEGGHRSVAKLELRREAGNVVSMFPCMTLCHGTLLAVRTNQYMGEDMRLSWTIQRRGDGKQ